MLEADLAQDEANQKLTHWILKGQDLGLSTLNTFCETLEKWKQEVLNFWPKL